MDVMDWENEAPPFAQAALSRDISFVIVVMKCNTFLHKKKKYADEQQKLQ